MTLEDYNFLLSTMERVVSLKNDASNLENKELSIKNEIKSLENKIRVAEANTSDSSFMSKMDLGIQEPTDPGDMPKELIASRERELEEIGAFLETIKVEYKQLDKEIEELKKSDKSVVVQLLVALNAISLFLMYSAGIPLGYWLIPTVVTLAPASILGMRESTRKAILDVTFNKRTEVSRQITFYTNELSVVKQTIHNTKNRHKELQRKFRNDKKKHEELLESIREKATSEQNAGLRELESLRKKLSSKIKELERIEKKRTVANEQIIISLESVSHLTPYNTEL